MNETARQIIDLAEAAIATRGYSAFSFREIAADLGIKSASVHYHFPTKAHLGLAVARCYRERYAAALEDIARQQESPAAALNVLVDIYRQHMLTSERMSVCMMLAAEIKQLPAEIQLEMRAFYQLNIDWMLALIQRQHPDLVAEDANARASQLFALLQGALMGAKTQNDPAYFERVVAAMGQLLHQ